MPDPLEILVVDGDPDSARLITSFLKPDFPALRLQSVTTGNGLLQALATANPSLILTECRVPGMSGAQIVYEVRARWPDRPIVMITGPSNERQAVDALDAGLDSYVLKSSGLDLRLRAAVASALRRAETGRKSSRAERRLSRLLSRIGVGVFRSTTDGRLLEANPAFLALLGFSSIEQAQARTMPELYLHPEERARILDQMKAHGTAKDVQVQLRRADGGVLWVQMTKTVSSGVDGEMALDGLVEDISALKRGDADARGQEDHLAIAAARTQEGLWDLNLASGEFFCSPRFKAMLGLGEEEPLAGLAGWLDRLVPEDRPLLRGALDRHISGSGGSLLVEYRIRTASGAILWMQCSADLVRGPDGQISRIAGSQRDITERREIEALLHHDTLTDGLTGLPNRKMFIEKLKAAVGHAAGEADASAALMILGVDRFQSVNDSLGHVIGDQLIMAIAHRLKSCLRPSDTLARLGGDEFAILLEEVKGPEGATRVAERIHLELERPFELCGQEIYSSTSIGIALGSEGYDSPETMLRDADTAMHRAKSRGRARHEIFHSSMHARAVELLKLESDLRRALERREFRLHFQPMVSLESWKISGFEALLRWQHPDRGLVQPEEFIPLAEDTGLIVPIARWVLAEACRQTKAWQTAYPADPPISVSVNLSGRNLAHPDLLDQVFRALHASGLNSSSLELEITETALIENAEHAVALLSKLKALNIRVHVDDFGTGYSSLSYLHQFPIDCLKIDQSFIRGIPHDPHDTEIVRTIVLLARNLGLNVVAEGVTTRDQAESLREMKCELAQGFFFHPPLDTEQVSSLLKVKNRLHWV